MKHLPSFLGGLAAGALLMYYLDAANGARRRALVRDRIVSAGHDVADYAGHKGKLALGRVKGVVATGRLDRVSSRPPESDRQLHERIRARLGRLCSHPGAVHVEVEEGHVRLTGHVLAREIDPLLDQLRSMPGVQTVQNALAVHDGPEHVPALQGGRQTAGS
jgi:osmotically-inducible protein OsmY